MQRPHVCQTLNKKILSRFDVTLSGFFALAQSQAYCTTASNSPDESRLFYMPEINRLYFSFFVPLADKTYVCYFITVEQMNVELCTCFTSYGRHFNRAKSRENDKKQKYHSRFILYSYSNNMHAEILLKQTKIYARRNFIETNKNINNTPSRNSDVV